MSLRDMAAALPLRNTGWWLTWVGPDGEIYREHYDTRETAADVRAWLVHARPNVDPATITIRPAHDPNQLELFDGLASPKIHQPGEDSAWR